MLVKFVEKLDRVIVVMKLGNVGGVKGVIS